MNDEPAQRTDGWHAVRRNRITASIVGAVLGNNPYMTRDDVMRMMVRDREGAEREFQGNVATEYGTANEPGAIVDFRLETGLNVRPATFIAYEDFFGGSPDGYTSDDGLLEVKCPFSIRNAQSPVPFKSAAEQPHYYDQMQACMFVTGKKHCHFYQWTAAETRHEIVIADQDWVDRSMPIIRQFYAQFLEEPADDHIAPRRVAIDTPEAHLMAQEYDELSEAIDLATERRKELLAQMASMAGERDALFAGRKLTLVQKAGAVSYAKAIKALLPDADLKPYTGKSSSHWKFT